MTMGQRRHVVLKSSTISEKQTAKKHEAAQRYLYQMSCIPSGLHGEHQQTVPQKQWPTEGEQRTIFVGAPDQHHVRSGHKNKLEEEKTVLNLKRGIDKELIQEGRNANARFVDLLILANSAELLESQDLCVANKTAPKGLISILSGNSDEESKELQPCVERDKIIPPAVRMTANIGDSMEQSGACFWKKDTPGNMNGPLNENNPKFPQEHGHASPNCETDPSLTQMLDAVEGPNSDLFYIEKSKRQLLIRRSESLAIKLAELVKEGPSVVATETGLKGVEVVRRHASLVEAVVTYPKELQPCVELDKNSPEAVRMTPDKGDFREQTDVCLLRKDSTDNKNCVLNEKNPKSTQEHGHAPNCQTETSLSQMSL